jgi:hypothetical protein
MKIITAEKEYVDDNSLDVEEMVENLYRYKGKSKSSCPNMNDWLEAFDDADDIFCATITSALSGSYNSACAAKQIYESDNEGKRVFVIDTLSADPGVTVIVEAVGVLVLVFLRVRVAGGLVELVVAEDGLGNRAVLGVFAHYPALRQQVVSYLDAGFRQAAAVVSQIDYELVAALRLKIFYGVLEVFVSALYE